VSAPIVGYHFLMPVIPDFLARYPDVELDVDFNDRIVDLIDEGVDVVIRSGDLRDSGLVSRPLHDYRFVLCASPDYLARHGTPRHPRELERHAAIRFRYPNSGKLLEWPLRVPANEPEPRLRSSVVFNNMEALLAATVAGLGIACMPDFLVRAALADGRVVALLDDDMEAGGRFSALWPSSRQLSPKVRVFVDHLAARLAGAGGAERRPGRG
jgi:DNA-binding transcriptional LysR family regulator